MYVCVLTYKLVQECNGVCVCDRERVIINYMSEGARHIEKRVCGCRYNPLMHDYNYEFAIIISIRLSQLIGGK